MEQLEKLLERYRARHEKKRIEKIRVDSELESLTNMIADIENAIEDSKQEPHKPNKQNL